MVPVTSLHDAIDEEQEDGLGTAFLACVQLRGFTNVHDRTTPACRRQGLPAMAKKKEKPTSEYILVGFCERKE